MQTFYLSFVDPARPPGQRWIGACFIDVDADPDDGMTVAKAAWARGCNPGGEIMMLPLDLTSGAGIPEAYKDRLLDEAELSAASEAVEPGGGEIIRGTSEELGERARKLAEERGEL